MNMHLNITAKLSLVFVFFAALLVAVTSMLAYSSGSEALQAAAVSELYSTAIEKQSTLAAWVKETQYHTISISESSGTREKAADLLAAIDSGDQAAILAARERLAAELRVWMGAERGYLGWMFLDPGSGQIISSTDVSEQGKFREDQPYFINGKSGFYLQNAYYSTSQQAMLMTVSVPIRSAAGDLLGVLAGNLDMGRMNEIITLRSGLRQSDDAYLVNTSELFVTQPAFISDPAVLLRGVHTEAVKRCLTHNSGMIAAPDYHDVPAFVVYRWLPERQLCLVVKMDQAEALAPALDLRNNILIAGILALMMAGLLSYWMARLITRPVLKLASAAREIGAGKLDVSIELKSADEIGELAGAFIQMTDDLKRTLVSRDELDGRVRERTTELQAANERLEKAGHMKDEFLASMSHELRTPLTGILGLSEVLQMQTAGALTEKQNSYVALIQDSGRHLLELINDILDLSKIESGKFELDVRPCSLADICRSSLQMIGPQAALRGLQGSFSISPDTILFKADARRVKQIITNMLSNAVKFTPRDGSFGIEVSGDQAAGRIRIAVWDSGIGIKEEDLPRLFQSFVQLDARLARQYGGTGLGLVLVRRLAELHGGSVAVESVFGSGSRFTVTLPWRE